MAAMTIRSLPVLAGLLALAACAMPQSNPPSAQNDTMADARAHNSPMVWNDLLSREQPQADQRIAYGDGPLQFSELWLPAGAGPHPTVLMLHGGCWQTDIAERDIMNWIANDLKQRGIAVWNVEYRGVDRDGGGYPGTYEDVLAGADSLMRNGAGFGLDLTNIVAIGHSAGGHLVLWLAARQAALRGGELTSPTTLPIGTAISQGGLPDLEAGERREGHPCGTEAPRLMARGHYELTSPQRMPAGSAHQILVNGERDPIAPPEYAEAYRNANLARDVTDIELVTIPDEGHVELITPGTASWARQVALIEAAFARN